ncbi:MAG: terminase family protein [Faecalibacterium sp.]|nr:terminase family protein [Faecalibacterium sp.]
MNPKTETVWAPQPRQAMFMARPEEEVLYGGAAGGGKSDALLAEALRQVHIPHYRGLILRKTYPQMTDLVDRSRAIYSACFPDAVYNATAHCWTFPSGAKIYFGSMQYKKDRINYQGKAYDFIAFDELTHFQWEEYSYMLSRNRPTGPGTRVYLRAATNPGGVGHGWVRERFIAPAPPLTPITEQYTITGPGGKPIRLQRSRVFVPSTIFDNQKLLQNDPQYLASLAALPEAERQALLYGRWDSFEGQVFTEWRDDPAHYKDQRWTHVIEPFAIPSWWKIWRGYDFGFSKPFSVGWYAADDEGRLYRIREFYGCTDTPNTGLRIDPGEQARRIREIETTDPMLKGRVIRSVADPAIFDESRGESIAAMMERAPNFIHWAPGDNTRLAGKMQYHYRFAFDADGRPMFQVFNTCRHFIRTIPNLVYDTADVEDVNTGQEDHIYDECRYVLMENPISPRKHAAPPPRTDDPLELSPRTVRFFRV